MGNLADLIEQYLQQMLAQSGHVELQRRELAKMFRCVPSQINYVLETRFTAGRGYFIESRRGGGGFIRIYRMESAYPRENDIPDTLSQEEGEGILDELVSRGQLAEEQALFIKYMLVKATEDEDIPEGLRGRIRARILKTAFMVAQGG